jgi:hypothetical protein
MCSKNQQNRKSVSGRLVDSYKKPLLNRICKAKHTNHDKSIHDSVDGSIIFNRELDQSSNHAETTF